MSVREFLKSEDSELGLRVVIGGAIPLFLLGYLGYQQEGLMLMIGSTLISGIDIPAELPRKLRLMTYSLIATPLIFLLISLAHDYPPLLYFLLAAFIFVLGFIAPFSFHFGKVAFMSNLAIMLSLGFSVSLTGTEEILRASGLIFAGGLWYMLFASLMHFLLRPAQISRRITDVLDATAEYFHTRSDLFQPQTDKESLLLSLNQKQADLTDLHEKARAMLMRDFHYSSQVKAPIGRLVHFFASLIDLFDEALATSWKLQETVSLDENLPVNVLLYEINNSIAKILWRMKDYFNGDRTIEELLEMRQTVRNKTESLQSKLHQMRLELSGDSDGAGKYYDYKTIQVYVDEQMDTLEYLVDLLEGTAKSTQWGIKEKDLPHFETRDLIRLEQMRSHLTFQSGYFRYALRVMITAMTAYFVTKLFGFQNPNWALFTVLVILKPGYRVSQERLIRRVIGTVAGVLVAYALFSLLSPSHFISQLVFLAAFFGGFAFMTWNYAIASTFFTIYILFVYAFLDRNVEMSAFFRFSNTILAAILSIFSIRFLFPHWENRNMKYFLTESTQSTLEYLQVVFRELKNREIDMTSYKIARKDAHLAMGYLTHSYHRILSEPKSKQGDISEFSAWVLSASSLMAVSSNIGLFLRRESDYVLDQPYLIDHFKFLLALFHQVNQAIESSSPVILDDHHKKSVEKLKADHERLKKEANQLAYGYTDIYVSRIHEYFLVHELLSLYHLIDHLDTCTRDSRILQQSSVSIQYS